jgi:3-hydroxyacyl-[acyl-carrier-protein] dehydratase
MTLLSVDEVSHLDGSGATGICNVAGTLDVFDHHFPRFPVLPGVLLLEALADLAAHVLGAGDGRPWYLADVGRVRFRRYVRPGDSVELRVDVTERGDDRVTFSARAEVDDDTVATAGTLTMVTP